MRKGWLALMLGFALIVGAMGCTKQVLPPDAQGIKLTVPNLFGG
jgi:hypothetical protein